MRKTTRKPDPLPFEVFNIHWHGSFDTGMQKLRASGWTMTVAIYETGPRVCMRLVTDEPGYKLERRVFITTSDDGCAGFNGTAEITWRSSNPLHTFKKYDCVDTPASSDIDAVYLKVCADAEKLVHDFESEEAA